MPVCDRCGEPIHDLTRGALTWNLAEGRLRDFRILHHRCIPERPPNGADPWQVDLDAVGMADEGKSRVFAFLLESICLGKQLADREGLLACLRQFGYGA
ncbi:MAG: hypothetical protein JXP34_23560 [Planctomycetes bacterium]|nr:hypothetical protein [Planctomycetota bacterium]